MHCQDHIELIEPHNILRDANGEIMPTIDDWKQTDIIRDNLQREYARKCFAPNIPSPLPLLVGVGIGLAIGFLIGWVL